MPALALAFLPPPARAQELARPLTVWDFDRSLANPLGGHYNAFASGSSWARTYLDPVDPHGGSGHALRITAHRESKGFCGVWLDFYSQQEIPPRYLDASRYRYLRFWIKGEKASENFDITLKDDTWRRHQDTNPTRPLREYLQKGSGTGWSEVVIPLRDFRGLDPHKLVNLVFLFSKPGDYRLEVDDIGFASAAAAQNQVPAASARSAPGNGRGLWVWNTAKLLGPAKQTERDRFLQFCAAQGIDEVFLSLELHVQNANGAPHFELKDSKGYRGFLETAHQAGIKVDGLAGTPEWAAEAFHAQAVAAIDAVIAFNRSQPVAARFDGVHFDVEPYSLLGYADPAFRPELLKEYLEMVAQCAARARTAPGLGFGCDVPAWFYSADELARAGLMVNFDGTEKTVGEHLSDLLDTVTIMDYRNEADGAGGIILSAMPALQYAGAHGKKIQVGLETSLEADRTIYFVCGLPMDEFQKRLAQSDLRNQLYSGDYRLATFSDDINVHVGLAAPDKLEGGARTEFLKALAKLALEFGASSDPAHFPPDDILDEAQGAISRDPELSHFEPFKFADPATGRPIVAFTAVRHMSPKVTFYGLGRDVFQEETQSTVEWLSRQTAFDGLAIHYYESYRDLVEGK